MSSIVNIVAGMYNSTKFYMCTNLLVVDPPYNLTKHLGSRARAVYSLVLVYWSPLYSVPNFDYTLN